MQKSRAVMLGQKIKKLREAKGLTQVELAVIVSISPVYVGFIENGRRRPSLRTLERLARALKVSAKDLIPY